MKSATEGIILGQSADLFLNKNVCVLGNVMAVLFLYIQKKKQDPKDWLIKKEKDILSLVVWGVFQCPTNMTSDL